MRQACETCLLSEIELVMWHKMTLEFFKHNSKSFKDEKFTFHDTQLLLFCLCVLVKEQLIPLKSQQGETSGTQFLITSIWLQKQFWHSFPGFYQLFKKLEPVNKLQEKLLANGPPSIRTLNAAYRTLNLPGKET